MDENPDLKDRKKAYLKSFPEKLKENKFSKQPYKNWSFIENDQKKVDKIKKERNSKCYIYGLANKICFSPNVL